MSDSGSTELDLVELGLGLYITGVFARDGGERV